MPTKRVTTAKLTAAIIAALTVIGGGTAGYQVLETRQAATIEALHELKSRHESDVSSLREKITSMRGVLDTLLQQSSNNAGKLDSLIGMVRDHMTKDPK